MRCPAGGILAIRCRFHQIISIGQQSLDAPFFRVVAERIAGAAVSLHGYGDSHIAVQFTIGNWNSDGEVGLASQGYIDLHSLPGRELDRCGGARTAAPW